MKTESPKLDLRKSSDLFAALKELIPHYTPEWAAADKEDPGVALLHIFSHMVETVINHLNQVSRKNFVAFLDLLGIKLLPAQPARVPLHFKLAAGTEKEILIFERTQATADKTDEHEELPFETEKNLLAVPSQLKKVISVDPKEDAIYLPSPGFLNGKSNNIIQIAYKIVSSTSADAKSFQLDNKTDLNEGDFLKIKGENKPEYVIISSISGTIITITDKLLKDYPVNTPVEKITDFSLFEGKNKQEHALYISHKDLFNIKGTARLNLKITRFAGMNAGVEPFLMSWEYWGKIEKGEEEEWRKLKTDDGKQRLKLDGNINLHKDIKGEITERKICGIESRWIRCILEEPLRLDLNRRLPVLDNIAFIGFSGEDLQPDQAFNNDIPLDVTQPFTPFGKEPRMFDNLYIASKEAFSKKEAEIILDVKMQHRGILGATNAITFSDSNQNGIIKVFAQGSFGRLMEVEIVPSEKPHWTDHGFPPDTKVAAYSAPFTITDSVSFISVFARGENGHLVERFFNGSQWCWIDQDTPEGEVNVDFDPSAVLKKKPEHPRPKVSYLIDGIIYVFVVSDGKLYEFPRNLGKTTKKWLDHGNPEDESLDSSPYVEIYNVGDETRVKVFVKGDKGNLFELDSKAGEKSQENYWKKYGMPNQDSGIKVASKPFAVIYEKEDAVDGDAQDDKAYYAKVFIIGSDKVLYELDTQYEDKWIKLDNINTKLDVCSDPHGYLFASGKEIKNEIKHIFVRSVDNCLWERNDSEWTNHQTPANTKLSFSPFVLPSDENEFLNVFSVSKRNSVLQRIIKLDNREGIWNEYRDSYETAITPSLSWEYWNKKGWIALRELKDETDNFLKDGKIMFNLPKDIDETDVGGQKSYWIRARIVGGDYGKEKFSLTQKPILIRGTKKSIQTQQLISTKDTIRPPIVNSLTINYLTGEKQYPQKCFTHNNLEYLDQSEACKKKGKHFSPFMQLKDKNKGLYLGFEKYFKGGLIKIFFAAKELPFEEEKKPKLEWQCSGKDDWKQLSYLDATEGLIKREILEFKGPMNFSAQSVFGSYSYWIRGIHTEGEYEETPLLDGVYPNTTWAFQAETLKDEILGSSDGESDQTFTFFKSPVLEKEEIRVLEILSEEEKRALITMLGDDAVFEKKDEKGKVVETWVLWSEKPDFFDSASADRHYILDRAIGEIRFGDGIKGLIPSAGDNNIKAFCYQAGGCSDGNVGVGEIKTLKSTVAGVDKVSNPVAADGGADTATLDQMLEIGPALISHRGRAVTAEDFEWLAKKASRKVAKVKCMPNTNNKWQTEIGWVTIIIVPDSSDDEPIPSLELRRKVRKYLEIHCAIPLAEANHIYVDRPYYKKINVSADVIVDSIDVASVVEREVMENLKAFFHPLTGGPERRGWDFGRDVVDSDVFALLEDLDGVDHVQNLKFIIDNSTIEGVVKIERNFLPATGTHTIYIMPKKGV